MPHLVRGHAALLGPELGPHEGRITGHRAQVSVVPRLGDEVLVNHTRKCFVGDDPKDCILILFADNFWLFASSAAQLKAMTTAWLDILQKHGRVVPLRETTWCTTQSDEAPCKIDIGSVLLHRAPQRQGLLPARPSRRRRSQRCGR